VTPAEAPPPPARDLDRYRDIVENMESGLHVYHLEDPDDDRTLRFIGGNPAAERITGAPLSAFIGRTLDENFPALREAGIPQAYAEVARTGRPWRTDQLLYGDDRVITAAYAVRVFPLPDRCVGVVFEDATERVRAQDDLRRSEARQRALLDALPDTLYVVRRDGSLLDVRRRGEGPASLAAAIAPLLAPPLDAGEERVVERTDAGVDFEVRVLRTAAGEHLAIVRDISERKRAERRKDEFISIVSHELRTPLTSIHGALGLIDGGVLGEAPPGVADLVQVARTNTDRLVRLINDMLDLDKMEAGRLELVLVPLDADALADAAIAAMSGAAESAGVRLRRVTERGGTVLGDRDRLLQVFTNLLSNAVRFSPPHAAVTITVRAEGDRVRFAVSDQGPGVPPDRTDLLFHKFAQVGDAVGRRKGGTGLGLAICKAIVVQHDGTIALVPTARGATFALDLPAVGAPMPAVDLLGDLRAAYAAALPLQVEALVELLDAPDPAARNEAHTVAHRLHGTAGTYGLPRVSDAAAWIERVLDGTAPRTELDDAVAALRAAVLEA